MAEADSMDSNDYDFLMDVDVPLGKALPAMNLRIQNAKLKGQGVAIFNRLSHTKRSLHIKVSTSKLQLSMRQQGKCSSSAVWLRP
jgi:hypothetical protein